MSEAYTLTVVKTFDAAHFLPDYDGKCRNMHGHTWKVEVSWNFAELGQGGYPGMARCFAELKQQVCDVLPDHQCLNEVWDWVPTAENIARWLCEEVDADEVRVWESATACATYRA